MTKIPLRDRKGNVRAFALVDAPDVCLVTDTRWSLHNRGYATGWRDGGLVLMHRLILGLTAGDEKIADHINRDRLDNRRENLRVLPTVAASQQNRGAYRGSTSSLRGVSWDKDRGCWIANARIDDRAHFLGRFADEQEAGRVVAAFRALHMPYSEEALAS